MLRRIISHAEFQSFLNAARSCRLPHFYVPVLEAESDTFAYGITITAKIANAVRRNRLKRRLKAWFYEHRECLPADIKINLIARKGATELDWTELCTELNMLIAQLKE